jgi:hypothetical protein
MNQRYIQEISENIDGSSCQEFVTPELVSSGLRKTSVEASLEHVWQAFFRRFSEKQEPTTWKNVPRKLQAALGSDSLRLILALGSPRSVRLSDFGKLW